MSDAKVIIQLSDLHIVGEGSLHAKVDTLEVVSRILESLESYERVDALLLTGDLADTGDPVAYRRLKNVVEAYRDRTGVPVMYLPGNHDERAPFRAEILGEEATNDNSDQVLWIDGLRIIGLDSSAREGHHGEFDPDQLAWLDEQLSVPAPEGTILAFHHPPIPGPIDVINLITLHDPERLAEVIAGRDVLMILAGHTHHVSCGVLAGVPVWVATATAYQVDVKVSGQGVFRGIVGSGFTRVDVDSNAAFATHLTLDAQEKVLYEFDLEVLRTHIAQGSSEAEIEESMMSASGA